MDQRASHKEIEKIRRDEMKEAFDLLKNELPIFDRENVRQPKQRITREATKYIQSKLKTIKANEATIDSMKYENNRMAEYIRLLERAKQTGNSEEVLHIINQYSPFEDMSENSDGEEKQIIRKNLAKQSSVSYSKTQKPLSIASKKSMSSESLKENFSCHDKLSDQAGPSTYGAGPSTYGAGPSTYRAGPSTYRAGPSFHSDNLSFDDEETCSGAETE